MSDPVAALFNEWDATIVAISRATARRFSTVDWEDVAQELRLWWLRHPARVTKYLDEDAADAASRTGSKKLMRALSLEASGFCQIEKARHLGYRVEDLYFYSTGALRELLPMVFDYECWLQLGQQADDGSAKRGGSAPNEGNNLVAALADVKRGLDLISEGDRDLLLQLYRDGFSEDEMAENAGLTTEAMNKRHDRALARLRDAMGGERPPMDDGPGTRRVVSNAAARAAVDF